MSSALFPDLPAAVLTLRQDRLVQVISTWAPGIVLSNGDTFTDGRLDVARLWKYQRRWSESVVELRL